MMVLISMQLKKVEIYNNKMLSRLMNICCRFYYLALILSLLVAVHKDIQMGMKTYSCQQIYSKDIHALHTKILKHTWKDIHIWRIQRYSNAAFTATRRWTDNFEKWRGWFLKRGNKHQAIGGFCPNYWGNYCFSSNYCGNFSFVFDYRGNLLFFSSNSWGDFYSFSLYWGKFCFLCRLHLHRIKFT